MNNNDIDQQGSIISEISVKIDRYVEREREEYGKNPVTFAADVTRQDAAVLSIILAVSASLAIAKYILIEKKLGMPESYFDIFQRIEKANFISIDLLTNLNELVSFRESALHDFTNLQSTAIEKVILNRLGDFQLLHQFYRYQSRNLDF